MRSFPSPQSGCYPFGRSRVPPSRDLSSSRRTGINSESDLITNDHSPRLAIPGHISDSDPALILNLPFVNNCIKSMSRTRTRTSRTILHFTSRMDIAFAVHTYIMYIMYISMSDSIHMITRAISPPAGSPEMNASFSPDGNGANQRRRCCW